MEIFDTEIGLTLDADFTSVKGVMESLISEYSLTEANIVCWVPHEVSSLIQAGWETGIVDDLRNFLVDTVPNGKWLNHDEPGTSFRYNFHEHMRAKLVGNVHMTLIVKENVLVIGRYQDIYFYSPVFDRIPNQKIFCRIMKFA